MKSKKVKFLIGAIIVSSAVLLILQASYMTASYGATPEEAANSGKNYHPFPSSMFKDNTSSINGPKFDNSIIRNYAIESGKEKELLDLEEDYFQLRKLKVNPIDEHILIENRLLCDQMDEVPNLLVVIPSVPSDSKMRDVIRETIGSYVSGEFAKQLRREHNVTMKMLFVVGNGPNQSVDDLVQKENDIHLDMLQADFTDTYNNLTKKMLIALKWIATYCSTVEYFIKVDTDVFVNIPILIPILKSKTTELNGTILGYIYQYEPVERDGKWKVTEEEFPFEQYPFYASGNAYVISGHILPRLVHAAEHFPSIPIEDAFITGFLVRVIGAKLIHVSGFSKWMDESPEPCLFFKHKNVTGTKVTEKLWQHLWNVQNNYHDECVQSSR